MPQRLRLPLLALAVAGCSAAPIPNRAEYIGLAEAQYPKAEYLVGYGFGPSPEQAEQSARADAASQISSQIQQNVKILESQRNAGGKEEASNSVTSELVARVSSDAGALIQPDRQRTREARGGFEAIAFVKKQDLDDKYAAEQQGLLQRLIPAYDRALSSASDIDHVGAALCEVDGLEAQFEMKDKERRIVTNVTGWTDDARGKQKQVNVLRSKVKEGAKLFVRPASTKVPDNVSSNFAESARKRGFSADIWKDSGACTGKGMMLTLDVEPSCGKSPLAGVILCKSKYTSSVSKCGETQELFAFASESSSGTHASDEDRARADSFKNLNTKSLDSFTKGVLGKVLEALGEGCAK